MDNQLLSLNPKIVWKNFYALTQIPRPSKKEQKVVEFLKKFGADNKLETIVDKVGNVIIKKDATKGYENKQTIVLQGHIDMVPQKNSDKVHDFEHDPIEAYIEGEWVTANGTTLGADNGIGVAAAMSVLESKNIEHGPIECLFTIDEETGMTGAFGLEPGILNADILINLDSEDEGEIYVGCAGGIDASVEYDYKYEKLPANYKTFKLFVKGLKGGHSGMDISIGRGNANKVLYRLIKKLQNKCDARITSTSGGDLRNAIPREAEAIISVEESKIDKFNSELEELAKIIKIELSATEPDMNIFTEAYDDETQVMDIETQKKLVNSVYACPNGVIRMSVDMDNLVETSLNLAVVKAKDQHIQIHCLLRSSVDTAKEDLCEMLSSVFELSGANVKFSGAYPGWKPNMSSKILKVSQEIYNKRFGKIPEIKAIHAGLECGLLGGVYPNLDMISFGPTIRYPHSPDEKVKIDTVEKFWLFLVDVLKNVPNK